MTITDFIHGASDFTTFLTYMFISYWTFRFSAKRPRYKKMLSLYTAFIFFCGITHLAHVLCSEVLLDSPDFVALSTLVTAIVSVWAVFAIIPFFPIIMDSSTQEEIEDLITIRTQELNQEIKAHKKTEFHLTKVSNYRRALSSINKLIVRSTDIKQLLLDVGHTLETFGEANDVYIGKLVDGKYASVYRSSIDEQRLKLSDLNQNLVVDYDVDSNKTSAYFSIKSYKHDYLLCVVFDTLHGQYESDYLDLLVEIASDVEFSIKNIESSEKFVSLESSYFSAADRVRYLESHDTDTGLPNKKYLSELVDSVIRMNNRNQSKFAFLCIRVNSLKKINEVHGHEAGDLILDKLAKNLVNCPVISIGRISNDELLKVIEVSAKKDIENAVEFILGMAENDIEINGNPQKISLNVGVSVYPEDGTTFDLLLDHASAALSMSRELGRNKSAFYDDKESEKAIAQMRIESLLDRDLRLHKIGVVYQPQVNMATGEIVGVEVLARWHSDELGSIAAPVFFQVAEYSGLIVKLGLEVLEMACRQWREWIDNGMPEIRLSVNASALQMHDCLILQPMLDILAKYDIPHRCFNLELTETVLVLDTHNVDGCLDLIRSEGIKVSIDDFGTGYSSLSYLKSLHTDELKIDKSFVSDIMATGNSVIVRSILKLAEDLKLETIAEGVETEQQRQTLLDLGCQFAQGYLFHKPLDAKTLFETVMKNV